MGLSAYSRIAMADGSEKRVEDIVPGDVVREPFDATALSVVKVWQGPGVGMFSLGMENGLLLDLTEDNLVWSESGMIWAGAVRPGMLLRSGAGMICCAAAKKLAGDYMVYDLVLDAGSRIACVLAGGVIAGCLKA